MAEIQELPIEPEAAQEIKEDITVPLEPLEPPEDLEPLPPAPAAKAPKPKPPPKPKPTAKPKGRPKVSKTRPPPPAQEPEEMPTYVREHVQQSLPPQPQDIAAALMGMLQAADRDRRAHRTAKYAGWVSRF